VLKIISIELIFEDENGNLKDEKGNCSSKRSLEQIIRCQDQQFIDFLRQCLKLVFSLLRK